MDNTDFDLVWRKRMTRALVGYALRELRGDDMREMRREAGPADADGRQLSADEGLAPLARNRRTCDAIGARPLRINCDMPTVETLTPPGTPTPIGPYSHIARVGSFITIGGTAGVRPGHRRSSPATTSRRRRRASSRRSG